MSQTLTQKQQHRLEQTLAQWPHWHCTLPIAQTPEIVCVLTPGISNISVLVESGQRFVVRLDGANPAANGLNRQCEWRTLQSAYAAGIAPRPCYFNPNLGSLVCEYLSSDNGSEPGLADTGRLLTAIHRLPARHHRLDLAERILRYEKQIEHKGETLDERLRLCHGKIADLLIQVARPRERPVLCHNDLLQANRIYSGGALWAIDWEYASMGSPWYDLAVVVHGDALSERDTEAILHAYLNRAPQHEERVILHQYGCIYRYLELLWYLAPDQPSIAAQTQEQKQAFLLNMLEHGPP
jgi:thiamine kinase